MSDGNTEGTPDVTSGDSVETTRQRLLRTTKAYLLGAVHDGTRRKNTIRISQKSRAYPDKIKRILAKIGREAWIYKEGRTRDVYVVEFSSSFLSEYAIHSIEEKKYYIRGYFDSEGGIAKSKKVKFYIYLAQKDQKDLGKVHKYLTELGISCGRIHNPSKRIDPNYWRFYISAKSWKDFASIIGSWHPRKSRLLGMKI